MKGLLYFPVITSIAFVGVQMFSPAPQKSEKVFDPEINAITMPSDSDSLVYPFHDAQNYSPQSNSHPIFLNDPKNIENSVEYDPETNEYVFKRKIGDMEYRPSFSMSQEEYLEYDLDKSIKEYWHERAASAGKKDKSGSLSFNIRLGSEGPFGSNTIDIRPSGTAELIFGVNSNRSDDPYKSEKQRRNTNFDFQEKIQMNVQAKIGDKIDFGIKYNTESSFEFERNKMKLKYEGKEDEIIKCIEAGDVTLPLNTTLINGSQSLFGIKSKYNSAKQL